MKQLFLDVETTGLWANSCAIHQIGWVMVDSVTGNVDEFCQNCNAHKGAEIEDKALEVGGKTRSDLEKGQAPEELARLVETKLRSYVDRYDPLDKMHFVAYNAKFDESFMRAFFRRHNIKHWGNFFWVPTLDVMGLAGYALRKERVKLKDFKLATVYQHVFGEGFEGAHDAFADIKATRRLQEHILKESTKS